MLKLIILGIFLISNAQVDKNKILERLRTELLPQAKDYNPYQYARESYVISYLWNMINYESDDCDLVKELIKKFYTMDQKERDEAPIDLISHISRFQCQEAYDFLKTQIKNNPLEKDRCTAIVSLAGSLNSDYISCILEYAKKDSLSVKEKLALAEAYTIFGIYASYSDLKEEAIKLLDEVCYNSSFGSNLEHSCAWTYYRLGGEAAINYHTSLLEKREGFRRVAIAGVIAELGEYETTFPIFVEAIHRGTTNDILAAIDGLKVIGTEEALRMVEEQTHSKNEKIAKKAQEVLRNLDKKRREE